MSLSFVAPFDEELSRKGPAGLFTCNHDGELCFDLVQTRYLRKYNQPPFPVQPCHCMLIDKITKWPQYALITSAALVTNHPQADIVVFGEQQMAIDAVNAHKKNLMSSIEPSAL